MLTEWLETIEQNFYVPLNRCPCITTTAPKSRAGLLGTVFVFIIVFCKPKFSRRLYAWKRKAFHNYKWIPTSNSRDCWLRVWIQTSPISCHLLWKWSILKIGAAWQCVSRWQSGKKTWKFGAWCVFKMCRKLYPQRQTEWTCHGHLSELGWFFWGCTI